MPTERVGAIEPLRERIAQARRSGLQIGCVPTMGALHAGHTALFNRARAECDLLVATLFVNPLQFDRPDDLQSYPRDFDADLRACARHGVDLLFAPSAREIYPRPPIVTVEIDGLADGLCGAHRPGHFQGVATVVLKLLNIVQPDLAYFGEKDYQQLAIVRRLVEDANLPVRIVGVETVRESDGLAISSRNRHLTAEQRAAAPALARALREVRQAVEKGESNPEALLQRAGRTLSREPSLRLEYLEIVDPDTLKPVDRIAGPVRIAAAAFLGETRLIDNLAAQPPKAR